jgi:hypothetical protein
MNDGKTIAADEATPENVRKNAKDPATLKAKREANVTAGLGYGLKKKRLLNAFWDVIWPGLERMGWRQVSYLVCLNCLPNDSFLSREDRGTSGIHVFCTFDLVFDLHKFSSFVKLTQDCWRRQVKGEGVNDGALFFLPPDIEMTPERKRDVDYYDRIKSVIERLEERRNKDEARLADTFRHRTRDNDDHVRLMAQPKRVRGRPSLTASRPGQATVDVSWKEGGSLYPKRSSRVGEEYQVSFLPAAGTYKEEQDRNEKQ